MSDPFMLPVFVLAGIEQAVNTVIALDEEAQLKLQRLSGKVIKMELSGLPFNLFIRATDKGMLNLMGAYDGDIDTTLTGPPLAILRMKQGKTGEGLFGGDVAISGDHGTGQALQSILAELWLFDNQS